MLRFIFKVAGTTFRPDAVKKVADKLGRGTQPYVKLEKEPDNPYDPKAVKVIADGEFIGYVPQSEVDKVHDILDNSENTVIVNTLRRTGSGYQNIGFLVTTYYGPDYDEDEVI
jgi:hypothetical protein